jgi:D-galactarolactone cycloisomerase
MKIRDLRTYVLSAPLERPFYSALAGLVTRRASLVVEAITDEGPSGFGEALCHGRQPPHLAQSVVAHVLRDLVVGRDPFDAGVLWEEMYTRTKDFGMKGAVIGALSAVDIALWDIIGRATGKPVHKLLGGAFRTAIQPYATGFYRRDGERYPDALVDEAARHVERGFTAFKVKIGFGVDDDVRTVAAIRRAVGPGIRIMVDANHAYNAAIARRLMRGLEQHDVFWLEEPISPEDVDGYRDLRAAGSPLLLAGGENEFTRHGFWPWVTRRALDVLQPDIAASGGFTGLRQILDLALAAGLLLNPHVWGTGIGLAASLQFLAAIPPSPISRGSFEPMLEYDQSRHPFRRELVEHLPEMQDGTIQVPGRPGLGVEVRRAVLERFSVS